MEIYILLAFLGYALGSNPKVPEHSSEFSQSCLSGQVFGVLETCQVLLSVLPGQIYFPNSTNYSTETTGIISHSLEYPR
jgi:hypothetical protein